MIRTVVYLVISMFVLMVVRMIIGTVFRGMGDMMKTSNPAPSSPSHSGPRASTGGELKKDPICGTFVPTATALQRSVRGETHFFCSETCRDKFVAS
jgi:YHS domain-containing protein